MSNGPGSVLIIIAAAIAIATVGPFLAFVTTRLMSSARRADAEARIREAEADLKESDVAFARARVRLANRLIEGIEQSGLRPTDSMAEELLRQASPPVATLNDRPLIGKAGISLS